VQYASQFVQTVTDEQRFTFEQRIARDYEGNSEKCEKYRELWRTLRQPQFKRKYQHRQIR
jgi:hypothetical protein